MLNYRGSYFPSLLNCDMLCTHDIQIAAIFLEITPGTHNITHSIMACQAMCEMHIRLLSQVQIEFPQVTFVSIYQPHALSSHLVRLAGKYCIRSVHPLNWIVLWFMVTSFCEFLPLLHKFSDERSNFPWLVTPCVVFWEGNVGRMFLAAG